MKTLRSLFGLAIVASALYLGWLILPAYVANYELEEAMNDNVNDAVMNYRRTDQDIRDRILRQAHELRIPLTEEKIQVQRGLGDVLGPDVMIWADYNVHVDLPFYPFDLHFEPASKTKKARM